MRLIDADALNEFLKGSFQTENIRSDDNDGYFFQKGWNDAIRFILIFLEKKPVIETDPVRHGVWVCGDYYDVGDVCSECDWDSLISPCDYRYCPNCGAKMDGGADNEP